MADPASTTPPEDPGQRWEQIRQRWLAPPPPDQASAADDAAPPLSKRARDPVFQQRIATLGQMLREANEAATAGPSSAATGRPRAGSHPPLPAGVASVLSIPVQAHLGVAGDEGGSGAGSSGSKGKGRAPSPLPDGEDDDEPDGGMAIRDAGAAGHDSPAHELKKVSEGIFLAFKQGRVLKEPLPLSLVTSLLFRSWFLDGTIPPNYVPEPEPPRALPRHLVPETSSAAASPLVPPPGPQRTPSILAALSEHSSNAVTPLPTSSSSSDPSGLPATPPAPPAAAAAAGEGEGAVPTTTVTAPSPSKPGVHPLQANATLEGMGPVSSESGKLKLDVLRGSRWRTEKEIASGSDVI
ncbi:hypothetical protein Rhopal_000919-T1 [Rhodotorula paludigena]|uniref:Uncharacterized protein n=1 Tax=Rhodotorula paludigena TaxID=86838 RepID=A0AAV5GF29_9BASI|nr:hypothetical protein Rhopal_000919-T1 [Rhodotorula paludigena]